MGSFYRGNWEKLTYHYPSPWRGSFVTFSIDSKIYSTSVDPTEKILMDPYVIEYPHLVENSIVMKWQLPENIIIEQSFRAVGNLTFVNIKITNSDTRSHSTGARINLDTMIGKNDGAPIYIPGDGLKTTEKSYYGSELNFEYWKAYSDPYDPTIVATGIIDPKKGLTQPDKLIIGDWKKTKDSSWDYQIDPERSIIGDSSVLLYFNPKTLEPGQTLEIITGYGIGEQLLPSYEKLFDITELIVDKITGLYCPNEKVSIKVDVLSAYRDRAGSIKIEIRDKNSNVIMTETKSLGVIKADLLKTVEFEFTVPNITEDNSYDVKADLLDENSQVIDENVRTNLINVNTWRCGIYEKTDWSKLLWLIFIIIILLILFLLFILPQLRGKVDIYKVKEGDRVRITVRNLTRKTLQKCVLEDPIPRGAEVDVITINVVRSGNSLIWNIGSLNLGETAVLEYIIHNVHVVPKAKLSWLGGEKVSN